MKFLLLTLATLLLLSQLMPGNIDLLREGAAQGDPGLVSEDPGARRTSCLGSRSRSQPLARCRILGTNNNILSIYLIHHPHHTHSVLPGGAKGQCGGRSSQRGKGNNRSLVKQSPERYRLSKSRCHGQKLSLCHTLCRSQNYGGKETKLNRIIPKVMTK